jgi:hypothetical protein
MAGSESTVTGGMPPARRAAAGPGRPARTSESVPALAVTGGGARRAAASSAGRATVTVSVTAGPGPPAAQGRLGPSCHRLQVSAALPGGSAGRPDSRRVAAAGVTVGPARRVGESDNHWHDSVMQLQHSLNVT